LVAKNLMLAYRWGIKTIYYSLINKVGAKANVTNTNATTSITSNYVNAADNVVLYEELEDADCEACKL
jgi:hypothetical protein